MQVWEDKSDEKQIIVDDFENDGVVIDRWFSSAKPYIKFTREKAAELLEKLTALLGEQQSP